MIRGKLTKNLLDPKPACPRCRTPLYWDWDQDTFVLGGRLGHGGEYCGATGYGLIERDDPKFFADFGGGMLLICNWPQLSGRYDKKICQEPLAFILDGVVYVRPELEGVDWEDWDANRSA